MKVAVVHDWLNGMRGGENVLEAVLELFPEAEIFTLFHIPGSVSPLIEARKIHTSVLQHLPLKASHYRYYLPLFPKFIEAFDLSGFDLVLSSSHCVAKGVRVKKGAKHISYVHAPMRYMWDRFGDYFSADRSGWLTRHVAKHFRPYFQNWDRQSSSPERVNLFIANSEFIAREIQKYYKRNARVIHPFVDFHRFSSLKREPEDFYLIVSALVPYKKLDLAILAFNQMKKPLWIVGSGPEGSKLKKMAGSTIQFLGAISNEEIGELYSKCRAFIFPGKEDFGITPLEAMAAGAPVIAFGEGGACETVTEETGIFFYEQTVPALQEAVHKFESKFSAFKDLQMRTRASEFTKEKFQSEFLAAVRGV